MINPDDMTRGQQRKQRLLLGLAISALSMQPGDTRSAREISEFCDCPKGTIQAIEKNALRKIRKQLLPLLDEIRGA